MEGVEDTKACFGLQQRYFQYWGKAKPKGTADLHELYHLLPYHSLDVAAVGQLILERNLFDTDRVIAEITDNRSEFIALFTFFLALHDIGKFASSFQGLRAFDDSPLVAPDPNKSYSVYHDTMGWYLWSKLLEITFFEPVPKHDRYDLREYTDIFIKLVTGHHGKPPGENNSSSPFSINFHFTEADCQAAEQFMLDCRFLTPEPLPQWLFDEDKVIKLKQLSWLFAGVTMLADWQGSDQDVFKYQTTPMSLEEYWQKHAHPKAQIKLSKDGYDNQTVLSQFTGFADLFPGYDPTPLQRYCSTCDIDNGPQLILLEDITGAGKTEAALAIAQRLLSAHEGSGLYIALPTMATSNAMFERMEKVYARLFKPGKKPSLVLAHGARHLSKSFSDMISLSKQKRESDYRDDEQSASGWCNYWFVDNRKKSLLADVGVGTVDQALLAILPAKHQAIRLLGVSRKILIIDEVHSYAPYESKLIQGLVKAHASLGGSTILLSATMPYKLRQDLVHAYTQGVGLEKQLIRTDATFPWVTQVSKNVKLVEEPVEPRQAVARTVKVLHHTDESDLWQLIETALKKGLSVCWIRNTVDDTIKCFDEANRRFSDLAEGVTLFHSRFCMHDRIDIEQDVLARFGKESKAHLRKGQLLISSPILDQSLDVDISIMISDIAPMDVLIQRIGRCCRHLRDADENPIENPNPEDKDGRGTPVLHLYGPAFVDEPNETWLKASFSGTQAIYQDTAIICEFTAR